MKEVLLTIKWPLVRNERIRTPLKVCRFTINEFGGSRRNTTHTLFAFGWAVATLSCNQYHDKTDSERADEYLRQWSACEKELQGFRLVALGADCAPEVKKVIRESFGVDFDEGTIK